MAIGAIEPNPLGNCRGNTGDSMWAVAAMASARLGDDTNWYPSLNAYESYGAGAKLPRTRAVVL